MFCQNCGAELRLEQGFCPVCGASAPRPMVRQEPDTRGNKATRLTGQPQRQNTSSRAHDPTAGSSLLGDAAQQAAPQHDPRQIRSFQAIRQASGQRGGMHSVAPVASLAIPAAPAEQQPPQAQVVPAQTSETTPTPDALPAFTPSAQSASYAPPIHTAPGMPTIQENVQVAFNGYHPVSVAAPIANGHAPSAPANGDAPHYANTGPLGGLPAQVGVASASTKGMRIPRDRPNRLALVALAGMFISFLLPWVITSGSRVAPLSIGWPVMFPLAAIVGIAFTILLPERTLYARFILALPFAFGCFALGSALVIFLVSSAIAANTVGPAFLGVDLGFILFTLAALTLAIAGYFKFLRELPLLYAGQITLAPLSGMSGRPSAKSAPRSPAPNQPGIHEPA